MKYYEIIGNFTKNTIGVCRRRGLLDVLIEENCPDVGEISEIEFLKYGNDSWVTPISRTRFSTKITQHVKLTIKDKL